MTGWTFKTEDEEPVIITPEESKHDPKNGTYYDPDINYDNCGEDREHPENGTKLTRIFIPEYNELIGIRMPHTHLAGPGWTGKDIQSEERHKKNLQENPMYTTMSDYKMSNPDSIPSKARKKNLKKLAKKNVNVKKNVTEK